MTKRVLVAASVVVLSGLTWPSAAEACSCAGRPVFSVQGINLTAAVFVGTVDGVTGRMPEPIVATFVVEKVYRGQLERRAVVSGDGTNCDRSFVKGETYLVYASERGGLLRTDKCARTRPLSAAEEDIKYLDNLAAATPQALIFGEVFRSATRPDGSIVKQLLSEKLVVVALSASGQRSVTTFGPYEIVLAPGDYELWVERQGKRVTSPMKVSLRPREERRLEFTVD
jgi:hypothetical protein